MFLNHLKVGHRHHVFTSKYFSIYLLKISVYLLNKNVFLHEHNTIILPENVNIDSVVSSSIQSMYKIFHLSPKYLIAVVLFFIFFNSCCFKLISQTQFTYRIWLSLFSLFNLQLLFFTTVTFVRYPGSFCRMPNMYLIVCSQLDLG